MLEIKGKYTTAKVMIDDVEESCMQQIYAMTNHVAFTNPIVIMPDTHAGKSSVIGFTMPLTDKVIPNVTGVDLSCGVLTANIGNDLSLNKDYLYEIEDKIRTIIPTGSNIRKRSSIPSKFFEKNFLWKQLNDNIKKFILNYNKKFNTNYKYIEINYNWFLDMCNRIGMKQDAELAIGTMGGSNHFIEIGQSKITGNFWITIHSGSRNFGKMICEYHQCRAKDILENKRKVILNDRINNIRKNFIGQDIEIEIDKVKKELGLDFNFNINGMEFLEGQDAINYFIDSIVANSYASFNRNVMLNDILKILKKDVLDKIETIHNYIDFDDMIIRKGAIASYIGIKSVIPFTMADGIIICEGKSNPEWNMSSCHGSGRKFSRSQASKNLDINEFKRQMNGIVTTSVSKNNLDESPDSYKSSKIIEDAIEPTVNILDRVLPILNIKDKGETLTWKERKEKDKKDKVRKSNRRDMRKMKGY